MQWLGLHAVQRNHLVSASGIRQSLSLASAMQGQAMFTLCCGVQSQQGGHMHQLRGQD